MAVSSATCTWIHGLSKFWTTLSDASILLLLSNYINFFISNTSQDFLVNTLWAYHFLQFRPMVPGQQGQQFMPVASSSQQFRTLGQGMPPSQSQPSQFTQQMQQLPSRPGHAGTPSSQAIPMPYNIQPNMNFVSGSPQFQQTATPNSHMSLSSSYTVRRWNYFFGFLFFGFLFLEFPLLI